MNAITTLSTMKALVYHGPGNKAFEDHAKPVITAPGDAIVRITRTTICGTDLHILKGDLPSCVPGTILGHEGVGVIESVGPAVTGFKPGDRVLISCVSACGRCEFCRKGRGSGRRRGLRGRCQPDLGSNEPAARRRSSRAAAG